MRIPWGELHDAFTFANDECHYFLLLDTSEIVSVSDYMDDDEKEEITERIDGESFVAIEPPDSHQKWGWMADFTETVEPWAGQRSDGVVACLGFCYGWFGS